MADFVSNNKQIAKNTVFLYFRMILIMLVTLYTSRVILAELGVIDYGIYNVVGGVVTMFSFLNNCMTTATQRFLTFELGTGNDSKMKRIFAASLNIHILIAVIIVLFAETIGLWFVNNKLNIDATRYYAANWVYQCSVLTLCVNIIQVPYNAVLIAHEKMNVYAYISILEVFFRLGIVYVLCIVSYDKLIIYGILVLFVQLIIRMIYQIVCKRKYDECHFCLFWEKQLYYKIASFAGWTLFGSIAWLLKDQGLNIMLNMFFGPVINAARAVAMQVSSAVMSFISNFQVALNPQITKKYAIGEIEGMEKLTFNGIKFSLLLLFVIAFPLMLNVNYILNLWLEEVPEYSAYFIILIVVDALIGNLFGGPLMTSLSATGNIRNYQIIVSSVIILIIPVAYIALRVGYPPESVFYVTIVFTLLSGIVRFMFAKLLIGFSFCHYLKSVFIPILAVLIVSIPIPIWFHYFVFWGQNTFKSFLIQSIIAVMAVFIGSWFLGFSREERLAILQMIKAKI